MIDCVCVCCLCCAIPESCCGYSLCVACINSVYFVVYTFYLCAVLFISVAIYSTSCIVSV